MATSELNGQLAIGKLLAFGSLRGLWTLEDLDTPSPGTRELKNAIARAAMNRNQAPAGYRNLARAWIAANPKAWDEALLQSLESENLDQHLPSAAQILQAATGGRSFAQ